MAHLVSPSLLAADFGRLEEEVELINNSVADWLHLDIMDGILVPNISFGFPIIAAVHRVSQKPLDVHLMIIEPERYLERFRDAGAAGLTVHYEACRNLNRTVGRIRELGMRAGVSLNPHTPVTHLKYIIPYIDIVLLMTVNPGYGGQTFISNSYAKIRELKEMVTEAGSDLLIQVDGGIDIDNASMVLASGADVLVAGSSVFGAPDPAAAIKKLKNIS